MEKLIQTLLEKKNKFDLILDEKFIKTLREEKGRISRIDLDKIYHKLFDNVDWDLKRNVALNNEINSMLKMQEMIDFDIKKYFYVIDKDGNEVFSQEKYDETQNFVKKWKYDEIQLQQKIFELKNKKLFKGLNNKKINKINYEIIENNILYEKYVDIFNKEDEVKNTDLSDLKKSYNLKLAEVKGKINQTIDRYVEPAVIENPELIAFNKIFGKNYYISSSAFLSNENNKNLNKYFDSSMITNKLANIYEEYKKARLEQDKIKILLNKSTNVKESILEK